MAREVARSEPRRPTTNATIRAISPYQTNDPNYQAATLAETAGEPLALSPKNKLAIEGDYTLPLPRTVGRVTCGATSFSNSTNAPGGAVTASGRQHFSRFDVACAGHLS